MTTRESETHQTETKQFILEHPTSTHRGEIHLADLKKNWFAKKDTAARLGRDGGKKKHKNSAADFGGDPPAAALGGVAGCPGKSTATSDPPVSSFCVIHDMDTPLP